MRTTRRCTTFALVVLTLVTCSREPKIAAADASGGAVQAVAFRGETYRTPTGRSSITLISRDELEYTDNGTTFLCKYSEQNDALRVIMTALGTQQVLYFRRVQNGLRSNDGTVYLDAAGIAELQRQEALERERREAAWEQERIERQRLAAIEAERQAEERHRAEEAKRAVAAQQLQAEIDILESAECPKGGADLRVKARTFVVSPKRECWTPWLYFASYGKSGYEVSGDIRVQIMLHQSMFPVIEEVDGPGKKSPLPENSIPLKVRFKSLGVEPVTVTFSVGQS